MVITCVHYHKYTFTGSVVEIINLIRKLSQNMHKSNICLTPRPFPNSLLSFVIKLLDAIFMMLKQIKGFR